MVTYDWSVLQRYCAVVSTAPHRTVEVARLSDHKTLKDKRDWLHNAHVKYDAPVAAAAASDDKQSWASFSENNGNITTFTTDSFRRFFQDGVGTESENSDNTKREVDWDYRQTLIMAGVDYPWHPVRDSLYWDETECLSYYGMLSLQEVFEIVASQLTETDIDVLSFLLDETYSAPHPLDPAGWTVEPHGGEPDDFGVRPSPALLKTWMRLKPKGSQHSFVPSNKPKNGLELLLELERRGYLSDGNLEPLLQLLRVLTRHDLLHLVSLKKRRAVSPERIGQRYEIEDRELVCTSEMRHTCRQTEIPLPSFTQQLRTGIYPPVPSSSRRRRKKRGNGWSRKSKKNSKQAQSQSPSLSPPPHKVSCDIRLRVRAEYLEHESALRSGVSSNKRQPLERQFELFSQANSLLRARDLGSIVCDIKFTELDNLEAFWSDYLSGALLEALKGVFITDSLRTAAGSEAVRLLISVDQDDYEEGQRLLRAKKMLSFSSGRCTETH